MATKKLTISSSSWTPVSTVSGCFEWQGASTLIYRAGTAAPADTDLFGHRAAMDALITFNQVGGETLYARSEYAGGDLIVSEV